MSRPTVLITEPIAPAPLAWLCERADTRVLDTPAPTPEQLASANALIVRTYTRVDEAMLAQAPNLRVVARAGVGLDNIDLDACRARGIPVVHTPEANAQGVVEYITAMMLSTLRPIERLSAPLDQHAWTELRTRAVTPRTVVGSTMGIIGLGRIGSRVARVAQALGMHVRYTDIRAIDEPERCGAQPTDLLTLARECDVISVHVDGRAENRHMLDQSFFEALRPEAVLINAARGFVLDTHAACAFARANPNATLILDVHEPEPIPADSPLWSLPNAILTPHIAAGTREAKEAMSWVVLDVMRVLEGQPPHHPAY
ncbi:MAG: hypothetical protein KDA29_03370 [Phycisphaerales bacterium]|nr:hypothetical protein [Phycisphaerales bacterium]